jgi:hypothetical protein
MAIRTPHHALFNLNLCLSDTLGIADIEDFIALHVIKMQGRMMPSVPAIDTAEA